VVTSGRTGVPGRREGGGWYRAGIQS